MPFTVIATPAPTSPKAGARSSTSTRQPARSSATADASPAIPPPTTVALSSFVNSCSFRAGSSLARVDVLDRYYYDRCAKVQLVPPPRNEERRRALADTAIAILATDGIHYLTHRNVDRRAGLPTGTTANYFPQRDELLGAAARRVAELSVADMTAASDAPFVLPRRFDLANLMGDSLYVAATDNRDRYLAMFELLMEATRRPFLRGTLSAVTAATLDTTLALHRLLGLPSTRTQVEAMTTLYGGALYALITTSAPELVTRRKARALARSIVRGVLGSDAAGAAGDGTSA
jgi:DNA-binding transcriptional regulator YbjK